jgi:hypothetical protein
MAVNAVPASRLHPLLNARWFRRTCRVVLALLALWAVHLDVGRLSVYRSEFAASFDFDGGAWLAWLAPAMAAGFLFGLATWLPLGRVRYRWSRLLLAALALAPLAQYWYVFVLHHGSGGFGFVRTHMWFADAGSQTALAILVGVAVASVFGTAASAPDE